MNMTKTEKLEEKENELCNSLRRLENELSDEIDELLSDYEYLGSGEEYDKIMEMFDDIDYFIESCSNGEVNNIQIEYKDKYLHLYQPNNSGTYYDWIVKFDSEEEAYKFYLKCVDAWDNAQKKYNDLTEECEEVEEVLKYINNDVYFEFIEEAIKEAYKRLADYPNNYKIDIFEIEDNDLIDGFFELSGIAQRCFYDIEDKGKKIVKTVWGWEFDEYDEDGEKNDLADVIDWMMNNY